MVFMANVGGMGQPIRGEGADITEKLNSAAASFSEIDETTTQKIIGAWHSEIFEASAAELDGIIKELDKDPDAELLHMHTAQYQIESSANQPLSRAELKSLADTTTSVAKGPIGNFGKECSKHRI